MNYNYINGFIPQELKAFIEGENEPIIIHFIEFIH